MKLRLVKDNDPVLFSKAEPVKEVTADLQFLAVNMLALMQLSKGIGLSAPQIGKSIRLIVFDVYGDYGYLFNPVIVESSGDTEVLEEGCLSFPKEICKVRRSLEIKVKYLDLAGKTVVRSFKGLTARVIQHELDHLEGITMHDREIENEV